MFPKVVQVIPMKNYSVYVYFEDGKIVCYDMTPMLEKEVFQTLKDIEIIVVNDGSKDCTLKKIRNLQKLDTRIKVIDKKNEGVMKARYDGLKLATGDYILFLDGDDWIDKSAIESLCLSAEKNSSDILIYNIYWAYDIKNYYPVKTYAKEYVNKNSNYIEILLLGKISVNIWDKFIKRDFLNKVNLNLDLVYGEDLVNKFFR